jgi:hypothetical protein
MLIIEFFLEKLYGHILKGSHKELIMSTWQRSGVTVSEHAISVLQNLGREFPTLLRCFSQFSIPLQ